MAAHHFYVFLCHRHSQTYNTPLPYRELRVIGVVDQGCVHRQYSASNTEEEPENTNQLLVPIRAPAFDFPISDQHNPAVSVHLALQWTEKPRFSYLWQKDEHNKVDGRSPHILQHPTVRDQELLPVVMNAIDDEPMTECCQRHWNHAKIYERHLHGIFGRHIEPSAHCTVYIGADLAQFEQVGRDNQACELPGLFDCWCVVEVEIHQRLKRI